MEASALKSRDRSILERSRLARLPDPVLRWGLLVLSLLIVVLIFFFFTSLFGQARDAFSRFGVLGFTFGQTWNVSSLHFGALPLLEATLITAGLALIIGVPVAVAAAIYVTELAPRSVRTPVTFLIDLLAAVPSVVWGLWGIFFLAPKLLPAEQWFTSTFSFIPFFAGGGTITIPNCFIAGLVLAIMILPIVSALSREVMATVPADQKEAMLGLGATRWEMIRMAVLPYCRSGITSAAMLGLGRALGETIAVTILIGGSTTLVSHLFTQGETLASVIASEFGEAQGTQRSALFAAGLVLFVLTLLVNGLARVMVVRSSRGTRVTSPPAGETVASAAVAA
jgi:phosphate ABC transporter permease protein PstC